MVDIKMSNDWQLTAAATGDAPITNNVEGFLQTLRMEALSQEGELFYDEEWGWSLLDFMQGEETELVKIELESRIRRKMALHEEILIDSIDISQTWAEEQLLIYIRFKLTDESEHELSISLNRIKVAIA